MKKISPPKSTEEKLRAAIDWINSPEGEKAISDALKEADKFIAQLAEDRKIPWEKLHQPMTI